MNPYKHQQLRKCFDISWREEYLLGLLEEYGDVKSSFIYELSRNDCVYQQDNAKKALLRLAQTGFVVREKPDGRTVLIKLGQNGYVYLQHLKELYK